MNTVERLQNYDQFKEDTIAIVQDATSVAAKFSDYRSFLRFCGVEDATKSLLYDGYMPMQIVDINPESSDEQAAVMVHLPMANPLDPNNIYQIAALSQVLHGRRIIASGNPAIGYKGGNLTQAQRKQVAGGDFRPTIEPLIKYAEEQGLEMVNQVGYSYGVDKAFAATSGTAYEVERLIVIEPASIVKRNLAQLGLAFASTAKHLKGYVEANNSPNFVAARKDSNGVVLYSLGLATLTNIAAARGLANGNLSENFSRALSLQDRAIATLAWGSASELANDQAMLELVNSSQKLFGASNVRSIRLQDQRHALANDIALQQAIVLEGMR